MGGFNFESFAFLLFAFPIMSGIVRPQCYMPERGLTMAILANSTNIQQIFNKYSINITNICQRPGQLWQPLQIQQKIIFDRFDHVPNDGAREC